MAAMTSAKGLSLLTSFPVGALLPSARSRLSVSSTASLLVNSGREFSFLLCEEELCFGELLGEEVGLTVLCSALSTPEDGGGGRGGAGGGGKLGGGVHSSTAVDDGVRSVMLLLGLANRKQRRPTFSYTALRLMNGNKGPLRSDLHILKF